MRRKGAPIIQPYRDIIKLLRKEAVMADNASWLFRAAPYVIFAFTWVATALVPTFASGLMFNWAADVVALVALLGAARAFMALAGILSHTGRQASGPPGLGVQVADRAESLYEAAFAKLHPEDRRDQRAGLIMAAIYRTLLAEIRRDGFPVLEARVSLTPIRKLWIAWTTWVRG